MNNTEIIPPIAPIDSIPEPAVATLLLCAFALFLAARWTGQRRATVYWTGGSMDVLEPRRIPISVIVGFAALLIIALSTALTLWISRP